MAPTYSAKKTISQHEYVLNPVTALTFYQAHSGLILLLAGEGSFLKVFDARTSNFMCQYEVFDGHTVHGIVSAKSQSNALQVAIWGGNRLNLLKRGDIEQLLARTPGSIISSTITVSDWILDIALSPYDDSCVLITAHNTVLQARPSPSQTAYAVATLASPSRSILYSADLVWESKTQILVAAGTVFGEIIIWQCSTSGERRVLFTFLGHEGSIFGVDISPPITRSDGIVSRLLASCSDDRTIRVWDLAMTGIPDSVANTSSLIRETGFGETGASGQTGAYNRCIATVMGHASRIWHVKFLWGAYFSAMPSVGILSFGEDSTTQQWSLDLASYSPLQTKNSSFTAETAINTASSCPNRSVTLSQVNTFAFHSGKHIWSAALMYAAGSDTLLATGGADGKISVYSPNTSAWRGLSENKTSSISLGVGAVASQAQPGTEDEEHMPLLTQCSPWSLETILQTVASSMHTKLAPLESLSGNVTTGESVDSQALDFKVVNSKNPTKAVRDGFNKYGFVSENQVLVTTNFGRVLLGNISSDTSVTWTEAVLPYSVAQELKSYTIVRGFPEIGLVCIACSNGSIYGFQHGFPLQVIGHVNGKVADMFAIVNSKTSTYELLTTTVAGRNATLFAVEHSVLDAFHLVPKFSCELPDKFVVTSAGRSNDLMIIGSRSGSLAFYFTQQSVKAVCVWNPLAKASGDAITTILPLTAPSLDTPSGSCFLTTERTGAYSIFSCTESHAEAGTTETNVLRIHHGSLPFGPMIEAAWFQGDDLFFNGFKSKSFVVWNETRKCEISNIECGGSHRSYAYSPVGAAGGHFVYTKASKLHIHSQQGPSHMIVKQGGHGREIKVSAASDDGSLLATGAEDTAIRIWRYTCRTSIQVAKLDCVAVIQGHTTGIQHLAWHGSKYLFSSGGGEEFFVWAIQPITGFGIGVICEAICPKKSAGQDLRIMSFDVSDLPPSSISNAKCGMLLISLAYSDSTIRTYAYSKDRGFRLLGTGRYTSSCLTQIRHVQVLDGHVNLLTAATDGNITIWKGNIERVYDASPTHESTRHAIVSSQSVHQSTVKSLDLFSSPDYITIGTGGDDNALAISVYPIQSIHDASVLPTTFMLGSAHSAAITGLCLIPNRDSLASESFCVLSTGNDQRVKKWHVQLTLEPKDERWLQIRKIGDVVTSVADVGDLSTWKHSGVGLKKALIVGNGMELWGI
ncbi:WD domain-containing protein [Diplocarpon rosae]|nr:WD domain-containing protein [Diplocarpon rosae]